MQLLLATNNRGKLRELEAILGVMNLTFLTLGDLNPMPSPVEDGSTFLENARKKAEHYFRLAQIPTLAEDSGLVVDALGGRPGVLSARFAPSDPEKIDKVLQLLAQAARGAAEVDRSARFVSAVCLVISEGRRFEVEGTVRGSITYSPRGFGGFGYDPIFLFEPAGKTFAEMSEAEKNAVSHRRQALQKLRAELEEALPGKLGPELGHDSSNV